MKDLKSTGDLRQRVREGMQQIATQLDSMLVSKGRKIRFDEEKVGSRLCVGSYFDA